MVGGGVDSSPTVADSVEKISMAIDWNLPSAVRHARATGERKRLCRMSWLRKSSVDTGVATTSASPRTHSSCAPLAM